MCVSDSLGRCMSSVIVECTKYNEHIEVLRDTISMYRCVVGLMLGFFGIALTIIFFIRFFDEKSNKEQKEKIEELYKALHDHLTSYNENVDAIMNLPKWDMGNKNDDMTSKSP